MNHLLLHRPGKGVIDPPALNDLVEFLGEDPACLNDRLPIGEPLPVPPLKGPEVVPVRDLSIGQCLDEFLGGTDKEHVSHVLAARLPPGEPLVEPARDDSVRVMRIEDEAAILVSLVRDVHVVIDEPAVPVHPRPRPGNLPHPFHDKGNGSITFSYGEEPIVLDFSTTIMRGEKVGIIGPNGCGKTTLFHLIMGLLKPQSGTLLYKGTALENEKDFRILRQEVGLLFQDADDQLFSPTVLEDVAFGPLNLGAAPAEAKYIAQQTLTDLGLIHLEKRITHHLSGGEKKLVSLATILAMRPRALLLDEPTNNLDRS